MESCQIFENKSTVEFGYTRGAAGGWLGWFPETQAREPLFFNGLRVFSKKYFFFKKYLNLSVFYGLI